MKYPIYFVSDNHFLNQDNDYEKTRRDLFFSLLDHIKSTNGTLIICGDFFDFWYDYKNYVPDNYKNIFDALEDLKNAGIKIYYILGNHDYWDSGYFTKKFGAKIIKNNLVLDMDGQKTLITHGDGALKKEWFYRLFRTFIRSKFIVDSFGIIPPKMGYYLTSIISKTEKHAKQKRGNSIYLVNQLSKVGKEKWDIGFDNVVMGHYHQTGIFKHNNKRVIFLGDWVNKFMVTIYDSGRWKQVKWGE